MTEPLRRVIEPEPSFEEPVRRMTIQAELPEHLASEMEEAVASGAYASAGEVIAAALSLWSYERWERVDPKSWDEHAVEMQRRLDELDADPSLAVPLEETRARLLAKFAVVDEVA